MGKRTILRRNEPPYRSTVASRLLSVMGVVSVLLGFMGLMGDAKPGTHDNRLPALGLLLLVGGCAWLAPRTRRPPG